ncbi:MAG: hybrid sensor histidine kinase/response regulator, partial [Ottowia sp.]|nr:hybrid sensor histidine kinase/response regulator [Ottowia sp.]
MVMSQAGAAQAADLGPLAWVLDETRRSIETASKKTLSFARDAKESLGVDMSSVDASQLRLARQQLYQAVGALDMVGQAVAAQMVRGMEAVVQQFVQHPDKCTDEAAGVLEKAGFALMEYLEGNLGGKPRPALGLFPQYAQIQTMAGADRVHPADLWDFQWYWVNPDTPPAAQRNTYSPEVRTRLDHCVLNIMRRGDLNAATEMGVMCLGLAEGESEQRPSIFWKLASAFMQALSVQAARVDIYTKRATSRILLQYASLAGGDKNVSERLAQDLLFFCAQADTQGKDAPVLAAVRKAWGVERTLPVAYDKPTFGLYDPAVLAQARRRIEAVKENWSALAGGDASRLKACVDQFGLVVESLTNLHQNSKPLADALSRVSAHVEQTGQPPNQDLAMETATAVLFLEASFVDFQPSDTVFTQRLNQLADRLDIVREGGQPPALEAWMEELYRSVSDRETLRTVVGELRNTLGEAEQLLDQFSRAPEDKAPLEPAAKLLGQMRGVLMVLGVEQAARAVGTMCEAIKSWQSTEGDPSQTDGESFEHFANSLGALGLLMDTLTYQPERAPEQYIYDEATGELQRVKEVRAPEPEPAPLSDFWEESRPLEVVPESAAAAPAPAAVAPETIEALLEQPREALSAEHLEEIAGRAALEEKPALARAASKAAEAARKDDAASLTEALDKLQSVAAPAAPALAPEPAPAEEEQLDDDEGLDAELLDIFLEEAREVVQTGG